MLPCVGLACLALVLGLVLLFALCVAAVHAGQAVRETGGHERWFEFGPPVDFGK